MSPRKVLAIAVKELVQASRDPLSLLMLLGVPTMMLVMYGYAINFDVRHVPLAVRDLDKSVESRDLVASFVNSTYFDLRVDADAAADLDRLLRANRARAVLVIPEGLSRELAGGRRAAVQLLVDGADANTATALLGYAAAIVSEANVELQAKAAGVRLTTPVSYEPRVFYNPELRSTQFLVPGLIGFILMLTAVLSTALAVVREKERGTMEQLRVTSLKPGELIVGKILPYLLISLLATVLIVAAARVLFGVAVRGPYLSLFAATFVYLLGALGFGLFVSSVSESQAMAFQVGMVTSMLPAIFLSGFIFPIRSMPVVLQVLTYAVPARYFNVILRGVILKGASLVPYWRDMAFLLLYATAMMTIAYARLTRKETDRVRVLWRMIVKEFLQLRQDKKLIPMLFVGPLFQLLALGYAANLDVTDIPMLVVDQDHSRASRDLLERFVGSGYFRVVGTEDTVDRVEPWLVDNRAQLALVVAAGYGDAVAAGRVPRLQMIADGTDSNSAVVGLGYASRIVAELGASLLETRLLQSPHPGPIAGGIDLVPRVFFNPDLRSRWFFVPAVVAMVLMLVTMILPSMAVVREKEIGTLEQIIVTPLQSWQLIVGKLAPFVVIGILDMLLVTGVARLLFGVPLRGSLLLLTLLTLLFLLSTLGFGLLVSTLVRTQQQAMMFSAFVLMVPMIYLSGLIFPIDNMPVVFQHASVVIPVRYYAVILRGIFLKGSGLDVLWPEALALLAIGGTVIGLAALRFRKSLD